MDTLKDILAERLKAPLFWYVAISWVSYNWSNIAILFMSKYPILSRIEIIKNTNFIYKKEIILPVISGIALTIVVPYINLLLSYTQNFLKSKIRKIAEDNIIYNHKMEMKRISFKAESDTAYELEKAKRDLNISKVKNQTSETEIKTKSLIDEKELIESSILKLRGNITSLEEHEKELKLKIINTLLVIGEIESSSDSEVIKKCKDYIKDKFSSKEIESAILINKIRNEDGYDALTKEETYKFLDLAQETIDLKKIPDIN